MGVWLVRAAVEENAYNRMKKVVKWYISGFYKKPKVTTGAILCQAIVLSLKEVVHKTQVNCKSLYIPPLWDYDSLIAGGLKGILIKLIKLVFLWCSGTEEAV